MPKNRFEFGYELMQKAEGAEEAEVMVYSAIVDSKWRAEDPEVTAKEFDGLLKQAKKDGATKLRMRINSPGGSVWQAVAMKTMLENAGFEQINIDIEGLCASAATFFVCVPGAHVRIAEGSEFMIHNPSTIIWGTAAEMIKTAERMQKMENEQHAMFARKCGKDEEQIKQWMDEETWFTAREAVEQGFADELMNAAPVAACADMEALELMKEMYQRVPVMNPSVTEESTIEDGAGMETEEDKRTVPASLVSSEQVDSSAEYNESTEEGTKMEINQITMEQLREENNELFQAILQEGAAQERTRMQQIDALTDEGFEELAQEAKDNGTSPADFLQAVIAKKAGSKKAFLANRAAETAPAQEIAGGSDADNDSEDEQIAQNAKEMAELAKSFGANNAAGMY